MCDERWREKDAQRQRETKTESETDRQTDRDRHGYTDRSRKREIPTDMMNHRHLSGFYANNIIAEDYTALD